MPTTIMIRDRADDAKPSLVRRALEAIRSYTVAPISVRDPALAKLFGAGYQTAAGIAVTDDNIWTFSAVYDAVNQSSSDLAKLPLNLRIRIKEGGSRPFDTSKTYWLLKHEANPDMSAFDLKQTLQAHALTCKGAFAEIERNGGNQPIALWPLTPDRVAPFLTNTKLANGNYRSTLRYRIDGDAKHVIEAKDMIHISGLGYDGYVAYPVIDKARQAVGIALAAERYAGAFFGNNANLGGILTAEGQDMDEVQAAALQDRIEKTHRGADRAWRLLVLGAGFKYARTGVTPSESQMDQVRDGQVVEVARFFNMPVHKLKNLDRATNNNIEQQDLEYYKGHQLNWITKWESELNRKLVPSLEVGQQYFKHNAAAALRGDAVGRTALYSALLDRGVYCADDVLELEDMNPQPNGQGKIYLVQGAMVPKDKVQAIADANIEKAKNKAAPPVQQAPVPPADPNAAARAAAAEALAEEARQLAQQERDARIAAEAAGVVTAAELERLRTAEQASVSRAAQFELVAEELRRDQQTALEARQRLEAELLEATEARAAAAASAGEASTRAESAAAAQAEADARAASATTAAAEAQAAAEAAERRAVEARTIADAAGADRAASEAALTAVETQAVEARAEAERATVACGIVAEEAAALRRSAEQARTDAEQRDADIAAARARIAEIETALETSAAERATAASAAHQALEQAQADRSAVSADLEAARVAAAADQQRATEAGAALAASREQLATLETALASTRGSHETAVAALQATVTALERQAAEVRERAEAQEARAASLTETVAQREAEIRTVQQADSEAMAGVIAAHRGLVVDIMRRMVERETDRARRAQATPAKLRQWLESFYDGHADLMRNALLPAIRVHLAFIRSADDPIETTWRLVDAHVADSVRQIRTVLDEDADAIAASFLALLYRWDQERPTAIADGLMNRELNYARKI